MTIVFSSDYEYDSDEEEDFDQLPPGGVNETLSKKKYCQSFKLFHQIFDSVKQFEGFQRSVSKMKKYVFGIIFALFLEALPTETRWRMPQELWEKVKLYFSMVYLNLASLRCGSSHRTHISDFVTLCLCKWMPTTTGQAFDAPPHLSLTLRKRG